jgi:xanthine dehydrogenase accessory factor
MTDIYEEIIKTRAEGKEAALVTIISTAGSTPREEGAKMLVKDNGEVIGSIGGGDLEAMACDQAHDVMRKGKPRRLHVSLRDKQSKEPEMICGGDLEVFIEPISSPPTLYLFGGGHISLPLAQIGKLLGFKIVVIDDRPEFANLQRFPQADLTLAKDFLKVFPELHTNKSSYIVIATRNHQNDEQVLEWALETKAKYIGMIGSRSKNKIIFSHLRAKGVTKEKIDKVYAPIGLEINAQTPEEIAISILAEIIKVRKSVSK